MKKHLVLIAVLAAAMVTTPLVTEARFGGSSSSYSSSRSSSMSSSRSISPSRLGGGSSVGMSRPSVMASVRRTPAPAYSRPAAPTPQYRAPVATAPTTVHNHYGNTNSNASNQGPGWGTVAAAGAIGYIAGNHNSPPVVNGGYAPGYAPAPAQPVYQNDSIPGSVSPVAPVAPAPVAPAAPESSGIGSFLFALTFAACGLFLLYWFLIRPLNKTNTRAYSGSGTTGSTGSVPRPSKPKSAKETLLPNAEILFHSLQAINNDGNSLELERFCTKALYDAMVDQIGMGSHTDVISVEAELVDDQIGLASIQYTAVVCEKGMHPEEIQEVWHFMKNPDATSDVPWLLAGIEQV